MSREELIYIARLLNLWENSALSLLYEKNRQIFIAQLIYGEVIVKDVLSLEHTRIVSKITTFCPRLQNNNCRIKVFGNIFNFWCSGIIQK